MTSTQARVGAKLGALSSAVALGGFVTVSHVEEAVRAIDEIGASLKRISEILEELGGGCGQPAAREHIDDVMAQIARITQENTELLVRTSQAAGTLKEHTQDLVSAIALAANQGNSAPKSRKTN